MSLWILIHSSPSTYLLQGCAEANPQGKHDWHLLILMDTKKHVITMTFTPSSGMLDEAWEQQRANNSEQNSKNNKCEFLMCCVLGHKCSLSTLKNHLSNQVLFIQPSQNNHLG